MALNSSRNPVKVDTKTEPPSARNRKCRVCLSDSGEIPIFGDIVRPDMSAEFTIFASIQLSINDGLPQYMCRGCFKQFETAMLFRTTARHSDFLLKRRKRKIKIEHESNESEPEFKHVTLVECRNETVNEKVIVNTNDETGIEQDSDDEEFRDDSDKTDFEELVTGDQCSKPKVKREAHDHSEIIIKQETVPPPQGKHKTKANTCKYKIEKKVTKNKDNKKFVKAKQGSSSSTNGNYSCHVCNKDFKFLRYYKQHNLLYHSEVNEEDKLEKDGKKCNKCYKSFSYSYYDIHVKHMHPIKEETIGSEPKAKLPVEIECPYCKKMYSRQYIRLHVASHDRKNGILKHVCDQCGKNFLTLSKLKLHALTHTSELPHKCPFCPYRGRHKDLLKTHQRTHTGDYNFLCTECPARFITKSNLSKHLKRHRGPIDFTCDLCKKGFYAKSDLKQHIQAIHLGIRNHVCNVCGVAFGFRRALLKHQLVVHNREKQTYKGRLPLYLTIERNNSE